MTGILRVLSATLLKLTGPNKDRREESKVIHLGKQQFFCGTMAPFQRRKTCCTGKRGSKPDSIANNTHVSMPLSLFFSPPAPASVPGNLDLQKIGFRLTLRSSKDPKAGKVKRLKKAAGACMMLPCTVGSCLFPPILMSFKGLPCHVTLKAIVLAQACSRKDVRVADGCNSSCKLYFLRSTISLAQIFVKL